MPSSPPFETITRPPASSTRRRLPAGPGSEDGDSVSSDWFGQGGGNKDEDKAEDPEGNEDQANGEEEVPPLTEIQQACLEFCIDISTSRLSVASTAVNWCLPPPCGVRVGDAHPSIIR